MKAETSRVVVLGASGRLGRVLVPKLAAAGFDVMGVARRTCVEPLPTIADWVCADLRRTADRTRVAAAVAAASHGRSRTVMVDLVLDRSGVTAMRQSLRGVTDTVSLIRDHLASTDTAGMLVSASTTAILAPWLYQTPYGLAKRQQVVTYERRGMAGSALLLPMLRDQRELAPVPAGTWPVWTFEQAAARLVDQVLLTASSPVGFVVHVPDLSCDHPARSQTQAAVSTPSDGILTAHLRSLVTRRDSMRAHRGAARTRLLVTPGFVRPRIDHHHASTWLLRRFASRYRLTIDATDTDILPPTLRILERIRS